MVDKENEEFIDTESIDEHRRSILQWYLEDHLEDVNEETSKPDLENKAILYMIFSLYKLNISIKKELQSTFDEFKAIVDNVEEDTESDFPNEVKSKVLESMILDRTGYESISYFILSHVCIEWLTIEVFQDQLIDEQFHNTNKTDELVKESLTQSQRENLLYRSGSIDDGLFQAMSEIRGLRNDIAHDLVEASFLHSMDDIESELDNAWRTVSKLSQLVYTEEAMAIHFEEIDIDSG